MPEEPPPKVLMEDGVSAVLMEDGVSAVLMEGTPPPITYARPPRFVPRRRRRRR